VVALGILAALVAGIAWGVLNGFLLAKAKIPALIVTLGSLSVALGLAQVATDGIDIRAVPEVLTDFNTYNRIIGIPGLPFVALVGNPRTIGDSFHITSDEVLTWEQIYRTIAAAAGVQKPSLVRVPSVRIAEVDPDLRAPLLGDKTHSMVFDNSKIKSVVPGWVARKPFAEGARDIVDWHDADDSRRIVDDRHNELSNLLTAKWQER